MILYTAIFIPIVVAIILYVFFSHKTVWWEFLIPFAVSILCILTIKIISENGRTDAIEYWNGYIVHADYFEEWNEYIHQTCTASCGKDCEYTYDCSYVRDHPPEWEMVDNNGIKFGIYQDVYEWIKRKFDNNEHFVELNRNFYSKDGDEYATIWPWKKENFIYVVTKHHYENRVQASESVFNFQPVTEEDKQKYGLFDYPPIINNQLPSILGDSSYYMKEIDNRQYKWINAILGKEKELRLWVLLFKNPSLQTFEQQKSYWKNGNKNEFVICVGINDLYDINWCQVFSWSEKEDLKIEVRNKILDQKRLNLDVLADWLLPELKEKFVRKNFSDFDYLKIEPTGTEILITFIIVLVVNICLSLYIIFNQFEDETND
jgi:hypothetical protein